jgi:S1-C subfamily serine protease
MNIPLNVIDVAAVLLIIMAVALGARSGFIVQALALVGFGAGVLLLVLLAPHAAGLLEDTEPELRGLLVIVAMGGVVLVGQSIGSAAGLAARRRIGSGVLGGMDRGAGAVFGFARGIFLVWLIGGLLAVVPMASLASEARQSVVLRVLDTRLPSPVVLAAEFGHLLEAAGLPDVFLGTVPLPEPPVDGPDLAEAEGIAASARGSTVRVEGVACGRFLTGSGFAVEPAHFVTNAHVVAGADRVWVSFDGSLDRHEGTIVHVDADLDAAVVFVAGLDVAPLELATDSPERGDRAAALGFTGGGRQRVIPAAISRPVEAIGRDIYGRRSVPRAVIEMRADVAPGDSGGPVVLADGTVGGVTFSESRTDATIGYALSPTAVADSIAAATGSTRPVDSGACLP